MPLANETVIPSTVCGISVMSLIVALPYNAVKSNVVCANPVPHIRDSIAIKDKRKIFFIIIIFLIINVVICFTKIEILFVLDNSFYVKMWLIFFIKKRVSNINVLTLFIKV